MSFEREQANAIAFSARPSRCTGPFFRTFPLAPRRRVGVDVDRIPASVESCTATRPSTSSGEPASSSCTSRVVFASRHDGYAVVVTSVAPGLVDASLFRARLRRALGTSPRRPSRPCRQRGADEDTRYVLIMKGARGRHETLYALRMIYGLQGLLAVVRLDAAAVDCVSRPSSTGSSCPVCARDARHPL